MTADTQAQGDLPELPEPRAIRAGHAFPKVYASAYTADQMREYGRACAAAALQGRGTQEGEPSEWISIDERLPEHEAEVLATGFEGNDPSKPRWTQIAHFHKEGSFYDHDTGEAFYPPTHWQPLPAAPRAARVSVEIREAM